MLYRHQNEDENFRSNISLSENDIQKMTILHSVDEEDDEPEISNDRSNFRKPAIFDSSSNTEEELFIRQDSSLFTSAYEGVPRKNLEFASAKVIDVHRKVKFIAFIDVHLFGELFPDIFPFGYGHPGTERKIYVSVKE